MQAQDTRVEPMRFHGPGWSLEPATEDSYWLWAPQDGSIPDPFAGTWSSSNEPRTSWAACWQSADGNDGEFVYGRTADDVMRIFPAEVREEFLGVLP